MNEEKRINPVWTGAGIFMISVSLLNYFMNDDFVSLGIFVFLGLGFILYGIKSKFSEFTENRLQKYALTFFFGAVAIFLYWLAVAKFHLF